MRMRAEQLQAFTDAGESAFDERLTDFLRQRFPDARDENREQVLNSVRPQAKRARTYGLETEREIAQYVVTAWILGPEFQSDFPAAQMVLQSHALTPGAKAEWLSHFTLTLLSKLEDHAEAASGDG